MSLDISRMASLITSRGGARPSRFNVYITNPIDGVADIDFPILVKATNIPAHSIGKVEVPYMGRKIPIPGDRTIEDWTTTIINDETFAIRETLEKWANAINSQRGNTSIAGAAPANYISQARVDQLSVDGSVLRSYEIHGIFPLNITSIELAYESTDQIEEFQVTWAVSDFEVVGGKTGNAGGA